MCTVAEIECTPFKYVFTNSNNLRYFWRWMHYAVLSKIDCTISKLRALFPELTGKRCSARYKMQFSQMLTFVILSGNNIYKIVGRSLQQHAFLQSNRIYWAPSTAHCIIELPTDTRVTVSQCLWSGTSTHSSPSGCHSAICSKANGRPDVHTRPGYTVHWSLPDCDA